MSLRGIDEVIAIIDSYDRNELIKFNAILQALCDGDVSKAERLKSELTINEKINYGLYLANNERINAFEATLPLGQTVNQLLLAKNNPQPQPEPMLVVRPKVSAVKSATGEHAELSPDNISNDNSTKTNRKGCILA